MNGIYKEYYDNSQIHIDTNYKDDKRNGVCKEYHRNGKLREESYYLNGEYYKQNKTYHSSVHLLYLNYYDINGSLYKRITYFPNGDIKQVRDYKIKN
jgi:antitoxin component YwqK of YwqJK toxin-antitoxin module